MTPFSLILKRFLKGLIGTMLSAGILYAVKVLPELNLDAVYVSLLTGILLAIEKALPKNF